MKVKVKVRFAPAAMSQGNPVVATTKSLALVPALVMVFTVKGLPPELVIVKV